MTHRPAAPTPSIIDAYGAGGFRVSGEVFRGSVIVLPDRVFPWSVTDPAGLSKETLAPVLDFRPPVEILLIGCGLRAALIAPGLRQDLRDAGVVVDAMDTGAACRTFNVLRSEERRVAAALIAI
ncbi:MAG TPA: Mth938-like domain-containing protein [Alphaproteobacteria bacterium]